MKRPKPSNNAKDPTKQQAKTEAFDLWLKRGLHKIYDDVTNEPIPDDLRKLIEDDRPK